MVLFVLHCKRKNKGRIGQTTNWCVCSSIQIASHHFGHSKCKFYVYKWIQQFVQVLMLLLLLHLSACEIRSFFPAFSNIHTIKLQLLFLYSMALCERVIHLYMLLNIVCESVKCVYVCVFLCKQHFCLHFILKWLKKKICYENASCTHTHTRTHARETLLIKTEKLTHFILHDCVDFLSYAYFNPPSARHGMQCA